MASPRQIAANQRNARSSHGPKTDAGKAAAAKNALKHGLLSKDAMLPGESAWDFNKFAERLYVELKPVGELECVLVGRISGLLWRLKRIGKLETGILMWEQAGVNPHGYGRGDILDRASIYSAVIVAQQGEAYIKSEDSLAKLSRYETSLERSLYKALHELQRLQAARAGEHVPAPVVIDVNVTERAESANNEKQEPSDEW